MLFSFAAFALVSALATSAADINVRVGDGGLVFNPSSVMAQLGDTVRFQFVSKNHSVTESSFATPCTQAPNGVDSGFLAFDNSSTLSPSWSFTLNTTTPLWFFCAQTNPINHCQNGMVFAVNPTADKTFEAYQNNAKNSASSGAAAGASGASGAPGAAATGSVGASGASSGISFPTGTPSASKFSTALSSATSTAGAAGGSAAAASVAPSTNGAVVVGTTKSAGAVSVVMFFAAVAGFLL